MKSQLNSGKVERLTIKTEKTIKEDKDAKHRMYVLDQWLKTQITYQEDLKISIELIKPRMIELKIVDQFKANKLFPYFEEMLKVSEAMTEIISCYKRQSISDVIIGQKLNKIVNFYKIYLEYFKRKTQIKQLYEELQKSWSKQLKSIQNQLKMHFQKLYQSRALIKLKISKIKQDSQKPQFINPKSNITIHDCLERPLYRLFKYHLLIDNYLKKLPSNHPDFLALKKTKELFVQIGEKCNNSFTEQERQDLKFKLQKLFGQSIPNTSKYITTMTAESLYFPCKLYFFSNMVIISKAQTMIGFRQEKKYINDSINEFSFVNYKKDCKYFKNSLVLCCASECIHLFLPDKGTRLQIYQVVSKIIQQQRFKAFEKRQRGMREQGAKLAWFTDQKQKQKRKSAWLTGLRFEIIGIDMRELGMFTNDTAYLMAVTMPEFIDDEVTYLKTCQLKNQSQSSNDLDQGRDQVYYKSLLQQIAKGIEAHEIAVLTSKIGTVQYKKFNIESEQVKGDNYTTITQRLQIHLSDLIELYKQMKERFPEVPIPEIDPFSKDFNFYTESKKKTKTFEVRSYLIQQFFNYAFRHPLIMDNPISLLTKLKIDENMWDYLAERSFYLQNEKRDQNIRKDQTNGNKFDHNHCQLCRYSIVDRIQKFQMTREKIINQKQKKPENYCFNFYSLLRNSLLGLPSNQFNSLERMLLYLHYFQGRIDYPFLYKKNLAKTSKIINVYIPKIVSADQRSQTMSIFHTIFQIAIDHKTTVGMLINYIARDIKILNMLDYRLVIMFNVNQRILDQDECVYDIIKKYEVKWQQKSASDNELQIVHPRNSSQGSNFMKATMGMLSTIKSLLPVIKKNEGFLYLKKKVFFPLYLQLQSSQANFQRSKLLTAQILQIISKNTTNIAVEVWGQVCGLYYCLAHSKQFLSNRENLSNESINKIYYDILPNEKLDLVKVKTFTQKMQLTVNERKKILASLNNQNQTNFISSINQRIIKIAYKYFKINTCLTLVQAKKVPNSLILDLNVQLSANCYIGVNYNEFIVVREKNSSVQTIRLPLEDVSIVHSVYSLFLFYKRQTQEEKTNEKAETSIEEFELRFDSKMLHGFFQLCEFYKLMKNKFQLMISQYDNLLN